MCISEIKNYLFSLYQNKGFLSEDEITDYCIDNNLDFVQTDEVMQFLLDKKVLFSEIKDSSDSDDNVYDKAQINYEDFFQEVLLEYPDFEIVISHIRNIKPPQRREWKNLVQDAQNGNSFALQRMTEMYLRGVLRISYNFARENYCDFEDAFQNGVIGLIRAIKTFDVTSPNSFAGYYSLSVLSEMQRKYKIKNSFFDLPTHFNQDLFSTLRRLSDYIKNGENIESSFDFIFDEEIDGISKQILMYLLPYKEIDLSDFSFEANILENICFKELQILINNILNNVLKDKEKYVIVKRFGLNNQKTQTLEELGNDLSVTRERIRQIEAKALKKLNREINSFTAYKDLEELL